MQKLITPAEADFRRLAAGFEIRGKGKLAGRFSSPVVRCVTLVISGAFGSAGCMWGGILRKLFRGIRFSLACWLFILRDGLRRGLC